MAVINEKMLILLKNISKFKYPASSLMNYEQFENTLANDLGPGTTTDDALAVLGYLLERDYARIIPDMGIVLNPENNDIKVILKEGQFN
jgi:hypothetical protein